MQSPHLKDMTWGTKRLYLVAVNYQVMEAESYWSYGLVHVVHLMRAVVVAFLHDGQLPITGRFDLLLHLTIILVTHMDDGGHRGACPNLGPPIGTGVIKSVACGEGQRQCEWNEGVWKFYNEVVCGNSTINLLFFLSSVSILSLNYL